MRFVIDTQRLEDMGFKVHEDGDKIIIEPPRGGSALPIEAKPADWARAYLSEEEQDAVCDAALRASTREALRCVILK